MKKKTKKPKDELIDSVLEDLKDQTNGASELEQSLLIGPDGIEASGRYSADKQAASAPDESNDKTTLLSTQPADPQDPTAIYAAEFFVADENKTKPIETAAKAITAPAGLSENPLKPISPNPNEPVYEPQSAKSAKASKEDSYKAAKSNQNPLQRGARPGVEPDDAFESMPVEKHEAKRGVSQRSPSAFESQFARAENLKIAQQRILELEQHIEKYRKENEMLSSAGEIAKNRVEELISKSLLLEKQKNELKELNESELRIFKDGLVMKDSEIHRLRSKVEELESRLANDLRRVRVRERELENRLELAKIERTALLRAKDETILELKRKTENLQAEIETYLNKVLELNQKIESNQDQFARTVRALRLALTNLEVNEGTGTSITLTPMKKAD
jgi:DNA repair exonuclease SbcCD ATPase subunit